jgi:hypothetical protein
MHLEICKEDRSANLLLKGGGRDRVRVKDLQVFVDWGKDLGI